MARYIVRCVTVMVVTMTLTGCSAGKSFEYVDPSETKEGAGLLSGKKGEFVLYQKQEGITLGVTQQFPSKETG